MSTPVSLATTLNEFSRLLFIYAGSIVCFFGIIGSCANLVIFGTRRYRQSPCALFIWSGALVDLIYLCGPLMLVRLPNTVLRSDYMAPHIIICKIRLYLSDALLAIPIWCICLSAFDRFCVTSRNATRRGWSTPKRSRITIASLVISWLVYRSPDLYYATYINTYGNPLCYFSPTNSVYVQIQTYFTFPVLVTTAPMALLLLFSLKTRANLRMFTAQQTGGRLERQMTLMVLLQALGVACVIPYALNIFYTFATRSVAKHEFRLAVENLAYQIIIVSFYAHYASPFYIYLIASSDVRRSVRSGWYKMLGKKLPQNQVHPSNAGTHGTGTINTVS